MEDLILDWMAKLVGFPETADGNLASGGSIASLIAVVAAREAAGLRARDFHRAVVYASPHIHQCLHKALRVAGLGESVHRDVAVDEGRRLCPESLSEAIAADRARGLRPWLVLASAGTADTGALDPAGLDHCQAGHLSAEPAHARLLALWGKKPLLDLGMRLGEGSGPWAKVWARFTEAPDAFPGVPAVLARSRPAGELALDREPWPDLNDEDEEAVRSALAGLPGLSHADACRAVAGLERDHGPRRRWVWARLGRSPLAEVLKPLARLAETADKAIGGVSPDDVAEVYAERGWLADAGAREALSLAPAEHEEAVAAAVRHLLEPWLDDSARAFQSAVDRQPLPSAGGQPAVTAGEDECILFVDGLRYELGRSLAERLEAHGCRAETRRRWAAIPTVTGTAKPAVTPVARDVAGDRLGADFRPAMRGSDRPALAKDLRKAMEGRGYQILGSGTLDIPLNAGARGWLETGEIDKHGHHHRAASFARQVEEELDRLAGRITGLLKAGWSSVRVVTDHGWLLLPGGLPLVALPKHLTESKWARCAVVSAGSTPDAPLHPWHWNPQEWFASPPGIACFSQTPEYAHGGLSIQECLIPDIRVAGTADGGATAKILSVSWVRFRCKIVVEARGGSVTADLRVGGPAGETVASSPKTIDENGLASLVLAGDEYEDAALVLVVTDAGGRVLAQQPTRKGENI